MVVRNSMDGLKSKLGFIKKLSKPEKDALLKLIARNAEKSYRRGVQQGATFERLKVLLNDKQLVDWRFNLSLDLSKSADVRPFTTTSVERLLMEDGTLDHFFRFGDYY